jgi:hypothetical protein
MACRVTGEVLVGDERHEIDAPGRRSHCWGDEPWWRVALDHRTVAPPDVAALAQVAVPDAGGQWILRSMLVRGEHAAQWIHRIEEGE